MGDGWLSRKLSYEEVKEYIEGEFGNGCKLLTVKEDYVNTHQKLEVLCGCGKTLSVSYHLFKGNSKNYCNDCGKKKLSEKTRMDGEIVYDLFIKKDLTPMFTPEDYINAKTKLPYICNKHKNKGVQYLTYDSLKQVRGCKFCGRETTAGKRKNNGYDIFQEFIDRGLIPRFSPEEYKNAKEKLSYICPKHPEEFQGISYSSFQKGHGCKYCGIENRQEKRKKDGNLVIECFILHGFTPLFKSHDYINNIQKLPFICNNHKDRGIQYATYADVRVGKGCRLCGYEKISGVNHYNYKGGISPLHNYLREKIEKWKRDSMVACDYKCVITNDKFNNVHHLYGFDLILKEALEELQLSLYKQTNDYTEEEIKLLEEKCLELHYKYPLGVCLREDIHFLFHQEYGKGNNTPEQFEEFKQRYYSGEFKKVI